jgi:hypothetical protein
MSSIMALLEQWPVDDQTVESWAQCTSNLICSQDAAISRPFIEKVKQIKRQRSCQAVLESTSFASIFETITQGERNIKSGRSSPTRLNRRHSNASSQSSASSPENQSKLSRSDASIMLSATGSSSNSERMLAGTTLQNVNSLNVSQQADQFHRTTGRSQEMTILSVSLEPMALDTPTHADGVSNSLHHGDDDTSHLMANTENIIPPDRNTMASLASNIMSPQRQNGRSTDEQVTRAKRTPSKKTPGPKESQTLPRGNVVNRSSTKAVTTPNNKRTWNNVNEDVAVVDLTTTPKKRTKSDEDDKSDESAACSPKPSAGVQTDNASQGARMLPVASLLEKALDGRCELEQMNVRYIFTKSLFLDDFVLISLPT